MNWKLYGKKRRAIIFGAGVTGLVFRGRFCTYKFQIYETILVKVEGFCCWHPLIIFIYQTKEATLHYPWFSSTLRKSQRFSHLSNVIPFLYKIGSDSPKLNKALNYYAKIFKTLVSLKWIEGWNQWGKKWMSKCNLILTILGWWLTRAQEQEIRESKKSLKVATTKN
jgi:hypothetical protein